MTQKLHRGYPLRLLLLVLASWGLEIFCGVRILQIFWQAPLPGGSLAGIVARTSNAILSYAQTYPAVPRTPRTTWTAEGVTSALVAVYLWTHALWAGGSLLWPRYERARLGARGPSEREQKQFTTAVSALTRARSDVASPHRFLVTDGPGIRMHWIGYVLVIDRALLSHRYLLALLAHELGHVNQEDRMARRLSAMVPTPRLLVFALAGLPIGIGKLVLFPFWAAYWRSREYAADAYAASRLDQGYALMKALHDLYLPLDRVTRFGRWMKTVPYVETRIGRIQSILKGKAAQVI